MSTTTMHFGPEWMRTKQHPTARVQNPPSPPATYSTLVSIPPMPFEERDDPNPFRYSKEEMFRIYREDTNKAGLGLEVQRWEGVVREVASEPVGLREMGEAEKKLFTGSLNSDLRRRQPGDYLSPLSIATDRSRINSSNSVSGSPLRERFGSLRRRDSTGLDSPTNPSPLPRKQSFTSLQITGMSPRDVGLPSPRNRVGLTPNFDGILSSGDSWVARRRTSELPFKTLITMSREASGDHQDEARGNEIREEEEDLDDEGENVLDRGLGEQPKYQANYRRAPDSGLTSAETHDINLHANYFTDDPIDYSKSSLRTSGSPPPGLQDVAGVEWSYKDPTGQIQGPFRADLMQKWFEGGFFSLDLPTKRTYLDSHWTTVADLLRRASGDKIFLSVPLPIAPPGLARRIDSPSQPYSASVEQNMYNTSLTQPSPIRTTRNSTLESYITTGSNPSDSPSSFGGAQFGNGSPDSFGLGGRAANPTYFGESSVNGRAGNCANAVDASAPFIARRATFGDGTLDPTVIRPPAYANIVAARTATLADYVLDGVYNPESYAPIIDSIQSSRNADSMPLNAYAHNQGLGAAPTYHNGHERFSDSAFKAAFSQPDYGAIHSDQRLGLVSEEVPLFHQYDSIINNAVPGGAQFNPAVSSFPSHMNVQSNAGYALDPLDRRQMAIADSSDTHAESESSVQSPWQEKTDTSASRRSAPLDALHSNAMTPASQTSPWSNKVDKQLPHVKEISHWSYQAAVSENRKDELQHDRLTFSNVVQHNQQYQSNNTQVVKTSAPDSSTVPEGPINIAHAPPIESTSVLSSDNVRASQNKDTSKPDQEQKPAAVAATPEMSDKTEHPAQTPVPKPVWSREPGVLISLREIQEAEVKKSETRKTVERAKTTPVAADELEPFTTSWGLPSSQVGARSHVLSKDPTPTLSPSAPAPSTPVWTNAVKANAAKKSMKEIQEEEERHKRLIAIKEPTVATAARKAPSELVNKASTNQGGAWTVIGPNGKPTTPTAIKASLVSESSSVASASQAPRTNGSALVRPVAPSTSIRSTAPKIDDFPPAPSHDFLRWLTDSLKGLNSSVNVEEIISMLLSFPLDPDSSTVELISDLIYTNSTTLDGRRFAAEFVNKRKSDAASRAANTVVLGKGVAKPVSIADVVKAAPKPAQSEWAFKVVNKKKKGGRT